MYCKFVPLNFSTRILEKVVPWLEYGFREVRVNLFPTTGGRSLCGHRGTAMT